MTRRVLLGTGAAVVAGAAAIVGARLTHRLDDVADAVGLEPKPQPDPEDTRIARAAGRDAAVLLATVEATAAAHRGLELEPIVAICREHTSALSAPTVAPGSPPPGDASAAADALADVVQAASTARAVDAGTAASPELARVLASMSAGLAQAARGVRRLR